MRVHRGLNSRYKLLLAGFAAVGLFAVALVPAAAQRSPVQINPRRPVVLASITLVQKASAATNAGGGTTLSATFAATPTAGDLLVAIAAASDSVTINAPAGWSVAINQTANAGHPSQAIFYKAAGASEPTTVTFTTSAKVILGLQIFEYGGATATLDGTSSNFSDTTATSANTGVVVTTATDDLLIAGLTLGHGEAAGVTVGNSFTREFDFDDLSAAKNHFTGADRTNSADSINPCSTSTSNCATFTYASTADWRAQIAAFKAAPPPPPTNTPTDTPTNTPSNTPTNTPTLTPTNTPTSTSTGTPTNTPTSTPSGTQTSTPTNTPTNTPTSTPSSTPTSTPTGITSTPTNTPTSTPSNTPTNTPSNTPTTTPTNTPTGTQTFTPTNTPTSTPTSTPAGVPTNTPSPTPSLTPTATPAGVATPTPTTNPAAQNIPTLSEWGLASLALLLAALGFLLQRKR